MMKAYYASPAFIYRHKGEAREMSLPIRYMAKDDHDALCSAVRFANNRAAAFDWTVGSIRVSEAVLLPIDSMGRLQSHNGATFFEWKCDWGITLPKAIDAWRKLNGPSGS